jgi:hypothetical protein
MPWTTLTAAQLRSRLAGAEISALKSYLTTGDSDPLAEILTAAIGTVRGYIAGNPDNQLGAGVTVPDTLTETTLVLARHALLTRLPVSSLLTEGRRQDNQDALKRLGDVAAGRFKIEQPETASTAVISAGAGVQVATSATRIASRTQLSGL